MQSLIHNKSVDVFMFEMLKGQLLFVTQNIKVLSDYKCIFH